MQWFLRQCSAILLQAIGYRAIYLLSQQNPKYYVAQQAVLPLCIPRQNRNRNQVAFVLFFDYNQIMIYALEEQKERRGGKAASLTFSSMAHASYDQIFQLCTMYIAAKNTTSLNTNSQTTLCNRLHRIHQSCCNIHILNKNQQNQYCKIPSKINSTSILL